MFLYKSFFDIGGGSVCGFYKMINSLMWRHTCKERVENKQKRQKVEKNSLGTEINGLIFVSTAIQKMGFTEFLIFNTDVTGVWDSIGCKIEVQSIFHVVVKVKDYSRVTTFQK